MKANALVLMAVSVVACGALLPEVKEQKADAIAIPAAEGSQAGKSSTAIPASGAPDQKAAPKPDVAQPEPKFSSGIADVVKLVKAGVATPIIEAYIQNSNVAYYPTAEEILLLHNHGVSSEVLQALIKRGGELRAQQSQAIKEYSERLAQQSTVAPVVPETPIQTVVQTVQPAPPITYNYYYSDAPYYSPPLYYPRYNYGYVSPFYTSYSYGIGSSLFYRPRYSSFYSSYPRHSLNVVCRTPLGFPRYTSIRPSLHHSLSGRHRF